eukprot:scaffold20852_cov63-Skeletonema_menzelii.AAC.1
MALAERILSANWAGQQQLSMKPHRNLYLLILMELKEGGLKTAHKNSSIAPSSTAINFYHSI